MKFGWRLFGGIALFYAIVTVVYALWAKEVVGIVALILSTCLAILIGFYFWFTDRRVGATLPEEGEQGFFSPHSWWPFVVSLFATLTGLGLILGWWFTLIGATALMISIMGWSLQYERR